MTSDHLLLHYDTPAAQWSEALPVGNGRLGAVIHGTPSTEMLQLNEDSVWSGGPQDRTPPDAYGRLDELRDLIRNHKHGEAEDLVKLAFYANPRSQRHYEPLATAFFEFGHGDDMTKDKTSRYRRCLDLDKAHSTVEYDCDGHSYKRETIASYPDSTVLWRFTASRKTRFIIRLDRIGDDPVETNSYADKIYTQGDRIILQATPRGGPGGPVTCAVAGAVCDDKHDGGLIEAIGGRPSDVPTPSHLPIADVDQALKRSWTDLVQRHRADYGSLFNRMSLRMWPDACSDQIATGDRLKTGATRDAGLVALYHNYGRYLLISSSRNGRQPLPATLQGIWNATFTPPWGSKFTININTQMNYWPAGPCGLGQECGTPAVDLLERMAERGRQTAKAMYGCRGWCAHHNTDLWADTSPQDHWMSATLWPLGGLWMCVTMMDMVDYCGGHGTLHDRVLACLEGAVRFVLDFLVPSRDGTWLVTSPSLSPENTYRSGEGDGKAVGVLCEGSTMDMTLIRVALEQFLRASKQKLSAAQGDADFSLVTEVRAALGRIPPILVNQDGLIQEWGLENYQENEPGHRHVSHLVGLHPGQVISPRNSPALAEAARAVLRRRLAHGGGHTGWSRAWLINMYARLGDGEACWEHIDLLLAQSTLPNLLDTHPPFQIDGNFGGCAGVLECLVQSCLVRGGDDDGEGGEEEELCEIRLLPACPRRWERGDLRGVRTRLGWEISFQWEDGQVTGPVRVVSPVMVSEDILVPKARIVFPGGASVLVTASSEHQDIQKPAS